MHYSRCVFLCVCGGLCIEVILDYGTTIGINKQANEHSALTGSESSSNSYGYLCTSLIYRLPPKLTQNLSKKRRDVTVDLFKKSLQRAAGPRRHQNSHIQIMSCFRRIRRFILFRCRNHHGLFVRSQMQNN